MAKRRKVIRAGDLVSEVIYTAPQPRDGARTRAAKHNATCDAQKFQNKKRQWQRVMLLIAANFHPYGYFVTFTFDDTQYPANRATVKTYMRRYWRLLRAARKMRGDSLRYMYTIEDKHTKGRYHVHALINGTGSHDFEDIRSLWQFGADIEIKGINQDMIIELSRYFTKEEKPVGDKAWICSKNLVQPTTESSFVPDSETIEIPAGANIIEQETKGAAYYGNGASCQYAFYWKPRAFRCVRSRSTHFRKRA